MCFIAFSVFRYVTFARILFNNKLLKHSALSIEKEIKKENEKLNKLYDFLENGIYSSEEFISRSKTIKETIKNLETKLNEYSTTLNSNEKSQSEKKSIIPKLENVIDLYYKLETSEDKAIFLEVYGIYLIQNL